MEKGLIKRGTRFDAWKLYKENKSIGEIADILGVKFCYVHKLVTRWKGTERMDRMRERNSELYTPPEKEEVKTIFQKLSEGVSFSNSFALYTTDYRVILAYEKMLNNHNSDIPL